MPVQDSLFSGKVSKTDISFMDVLRFAASYWRRQPVRLGCAMTLMVMAALLETAIPSLVASFLDALRQHETEALVLEKLLLTIGAYLGSVVLFSSCYVTYNMFETNVFRMLLNDVFTHVQSLSEHFFVNTFTGSIISKVNRARQKIEQFEDLVLLRFAGTAVILGGSLVFLALRFPLLAAVIFAYLVLLVLASLWFVFYFAGPPQRVHADAQDVFGAKLADGISGIFTTKAYAQEERECGRFYDATATLRGVNLRAYIYSNLTGGFQKLLLGGMLALLLGGGAWYYRQGMASVEDVAYLALAYTLIASYVSEVGDHVKTLLTSSYDLHAVIALMRVKPDVVDAPQAAPLRVTQGALTFESVGFTYPGKTAPVFTDFSVSIKPGERVALVGKSGSGKTTFVRLVQRLYAVQQGRILLDGQDTALGTQESLRKAIALVPQDPILFHRTLAENIAYGRPDATLDEIRVAAQKASIDAFIRGLPLGYDTLVGERGIKLSGGERQRVAIARALLADRPLLILDEATSSLDSFSERAIQDALHTLMRGRTSIMIAHRLSTILNADRILVFDGGRIVEEGTHADLILRENGLYAGLFKMQSSGFLAE